MEQNKQAYTYDFSFDDGAESNFRMTIGGTVYNVTTHFDPQGRQCVLEQFKDLLLQRNWNMPAQSKIRPENTTMGYPLFDPAAGKESKNNDSQ